MVITVKFDFSASGHNRDSQFMNDIHPQFVELCKDIIDCPVNFNTQITAHNGLIGSVTYILDTSADTLYSFLRCFASFMSGYNSSEYLWLALCFKGIKIN
jgi:hypothetical protein